MTPQLLTRRMHTWLAWIVGLQVTLWVVSGLYMSAVPIDTIHGDHLVRADDRVLNPDVSVDAAALRRRFPDLDGFTLKTLHARPVYEVRHGAATELMDAVSGALHSPLNAAAVRELAQARYAGAEPIRAIEWLTQAPPEVANRPAPLWRVTFEGASTPTLYYSPVTGELLAKRHVGWRVFDALWMLHIMDYATRSNVNNPLLRTAAIAAIGFATTGIVLLFYAFRRRPTLSGPRAPKKPVSRRLHQWLGLLVGLQLLIWIGSGLTMNLLDHEGVEGHRYRRVAAHEEATVPADLLEPAVLAERLGGRIATMEFRVALDGPVYLARTADGVRRFNARTGEPQPVDATAARAIALADYSGPGRIGIAELLAAPNSETRGHDGPLWRVAVDDDLATTLYVSSTDGRVLERRNRVWRLFDIAWMLHIMDYRHRENFNHPLLVGMALGGVWLAGSGVWLLLCRLRRPRRVGVGVTP